VYRLATVGGDPVVVKIAKTAADAASIRREAETLLFVDSRHVPTLLGVGERAPTPGDAPLPYLVLPFQPGVSLAERAPSSAAEASSDDARAILGLARDLGTALADLERAGLAHGDLKPANVWLAEHDEHEGGARLLDLGLAGPSHGPPEGGTPRYAAPEVGSPTAERRLCDRYSLGVLLAERLVGLPPAPAPLEATSPGGLAPGERLRAALGAAGPGSVALAPLHPLVVALLDPVPGKRPAPTLVAAVAAQALGEPRQPADSQGAIRTTYLSLRRAELLSAARRPDLVAAPGQEGTETTAPAFVRPRFALLRALAGAATAPGTDLAPPLPPLDELGVRRLLSRFLGPWAARIPLGALAEGDDDARLGLLLALAEHRDPTGFTAEDFVKHPVLPGALPATVSPPLGTPLTAEPVEGAVDPIALGIALCAPRPTEAALRAATSFLERVGDAAPRFEALRAALVGALGRRGDWAAALLVVPTDEPASLDAATRRILADLARKTGDRALALRLVGTSEPALAARVAFDENDLPRARALLSLTAPDDPRAAEVRGLVLLGEGRAEEATEAASRGLALARDEETQARLSGVLGYIAHARGEVGASLQAYQDAAGSAARAGAVLEEATYLTGVAAAATDSGAFGAALLAARRATLLWESLGRRREAGRALLSQAAALRVLGASLEARALADEARTLLAEGADARGAAFASLVLADSLDDDEAARAAVRWALDEHHEHGPSGLSAPADRLRGMARLHRFGALSAAGRAEADRLAAAPTTDLVARLEWWTSRGQVSLDGFRARGLDASAPLDETAAEAHPSLRALPLLLDAPAPIDARAEAAWVTARLAAQAGDGPLTRRATAVLRHLSHVVATHAALSPAAAPGHALTSISWWAAASVEPGRGVGALGRDDSTEILQLFRALTTRESLREVLRQVLDALVLWTGVERGLLLLPVGETLVPRAARNLSRDDLRGEQLSLSLSLARRAFLTREPVVSVDAFHEHDLVASVHALRLRSVLAVPLIARGDVVGVVYLDDRVRRGAFGEREVSWVTLAAGAAALAIADTRDRALLRRAVRRAERAQRVSEARMLEKEVALTALERTRAPRPFIRDHASTRAIIGTSPLLEAALRLVDRVAPTDLPVLLSGESGTGKELFAQAVHEGSLRAKKRFVSESCAAIPENLLETTLFGHERGAFTGAVAAREGLFAVADGGTLFLDEVGELPLPLQAKLLRVLQSGELRPVGANTARKVNVRIVAATHRDLPTEVREGRFREDLYYRLAGVLVKVPALRERQGDIPLLVTHFLAKYSTDGPARITRDALECLTAYPFPGNVRQLENEIRRALALAQQGGVIELTTLSEELRAPARESRARELSLQVRQRVDDLERELIREALIRSGGNKTRAAELLGVSRFGLSKMEKRLSLP
jgi:serine/threonine-protein kinase PknK